MSNAVNTTGNLPGYKQYQTPNYTPEQMQLHQGLFAHLGPNSFLSQLAGGSPQAFAQMETPALKQFSGMLGNIGSRFSGQGLGGRHSSGFQNTANQAASNFAEQLQSNRVGLQRQAVQDLFGLSNQLLQQKPYENYLMQNAPGFWQSLIGGAAPGIGGLLGGIYGGPSGAMIGSQMGGAVGRAMF